MHAVADNAITLFGVDKKPLSHLLRGFIAIISLPSVLWLYVLADVIINGFRSLITKFVRV